MLVAAVYALFLFARLAANGFDPSHFVCAGDGFCDPASTPTNLKVNSESNGYDGQNFYRLAVKPWTTRRVEYGIDLAPPAYRHQRILYPLLVWLCSLGRPALTPIMLILINYTALCGVGYVGAQLVKGSDLPPFYGIVFPLYPGFVLSLSRNLSEICGAFFLLAGLALLERRKDFAAAIMLAFAVPARETTILATGAILLCAAARVISGHRQFRRRFYLIPLATYVVWQITLRLIWGEFPAYSGGRLFAYPLQGVFRAVRTMSALQTPSQVLWLTELCVIAGFTAVVFWALRETRTQQHEMVGWVLYALLASVLSYDIWREDWGFFRALTEFHVLGALILVKTTHRLRISLAFAYGLLWLFLTCLRTDIHRSLLY